MSPPDEKWVREVCKPGHGAACCIYLLMSAKGWGCGKLDEGVRRQIDARRPAMTAQGDNCPGKGMPQW